MLAITLYDKDIFFYYEDDASICCIILILLNEKKKRKIRNLKKALCWTIEYRPFPPVFVLFTYKTNSKWNGSFKLPAVKKARGVMTSNCVMIMTMSMACDMIFITKNAISSCLSLIKILCPSPLPQGYAVLYSDQALSFLKGCWLTRWLTRTLILR